MRWKTMMTMNEELLLLLEKAQQSLAGWIVDWFFTRSASVSDSSFPFYQRLNAITISTDQD